MTEAGLCGLIVVSMMVVSGIAGICIYWHDSSTRLRVTMLIILIAVVACEMVILFRLLRPAVYAESRKDGIHVILREAGELVYLDWADVKDYRVVYRGLSAPKINYDLLILQRDAMFADKPIHKLRVYQLADEPAISDHRLDELMEKLHMGTMTVDEFKNQPYIFMISENTWNNMKMWRRRREFSQEKDHTEDNLQR